MRPSPAFVQSVESSSTNKFSKFNVDMSCSSITSPSFCSNFTERVYITAIGCEIGFGDRATTVAGVCDILEADLFKFCKAIHVFRENRMRRNISKSARAHQACEPRIINDRWMKLNNDSVRACQPLSRAVE